MIVWCGNTNSTTNQLTRRFLLASDLELKLLSGTISSNNFVKFVTEVSLRLLPCRSTEETQKKKTREEEEEEEEESNLINLKRSI